MLLQISQNETGMDCEPGFQREQGRIIKVKNVQVTHYLPNGLRTNTLQITGISHH